MDEDIFMLLGSMFVVLCVVGGVIWVVDMVLGGEVVNVFVVICLFGYYVE